MEEPPVPQPSTTRPADAVLRYGNHSEQVADLYLPVARAVPASPLPLLVVVHGGFWRQRYDRAHALPQVLALADAGWPVAALEYRRVGGDGGVPATFDDIATAVDAVPQLSSAVAPGWVDADRAVLVGHSAGGHLALWASARHLLPPSSRWHRDATSTALAVVSLAGVCSLAAAVADDLGSGAAKALLAGASPEHLDPGLLPATGVPTFLLHGSDDETVPARYSEQHAERLSAAGTPVDLAVLPGTGHFEPITPASTAWATVLHYVGRAVEAVTTLRERAR
ncbi:MAG: alpha/beta hydrolase family protein [Actinomycetes bacterium]